MINFSLTLDQANLIMKHLGNGPYAEVAPLIAEIQKQAAPQINPQQAAPPPIPE